MKQQLLGMMMATLAGCTADGHFFNPDLFKAFPETAMPASTTVRSTDVVADLSALTYQPLAAAYDMPFAIDDRSPVVALPDGASPVATFAVPAQLGAVKVEVTSRVGMTVFAPNLLALDDQFQRVATFHAVQYVPARRDQPDQLMLKAQFDSADVRYLVVYTTSEQLTGRTQLIDPETEYNRSIGIDRPPRQPLYAQHETRGRLSILLEPLPATAATHVGLTASNRSWMPMMAPSFTATSVAMNDSAFRVFVSD